MRELRRNAYVEVPNGALWYAPPNYPHDWEMVFANKNVDRDALLAEVKKETGLDIQFSGLLYKGNRMNKQIQPLIARGEIYFWDGKEFQLYTEGQASLKQAQEVAKLKPIDIQKLLRLSVAQAVIDQTTEDINGRVPHDNEDLYLNGFNEVGDAATNLLNTWRYFREGSAAFLKGDSLELPEIFNDDFELDRTGRWASAVWWNQDDYEMISGEEAYGDITRDNKKFRSFKKEDRNGEPEGEPAAQDEQMLDPVENGTLLFYASEERMKSLLEGGDSISQMTEALAFVADYERVLNLGDAEPGKIIDAIMTEWFRFTPDRNEMIPAITWTGGRWDVSTASGLLSEKSKAMLSTLYAMTEVLARTSLPVATPIKINKAEAYYEPVSPEKEFLSACQTCVNFDNGSCLKVEGDIDKGAICAWYEANQASLVNRFDALAFEEISASDPVTVWAANLEQLFLAMNMPEVYTLRSAWLNEPAPDGKIYGSLLLYMAGVSKSAGTVNEVTMSAGFEARKTALLNTCLSKITDEMRNAANRIGESPIQILAPYAKDADLERKTGLKRNTKRQRVKARTHKSVIDMGTEDTILTPKKSAPRAAPGKKVELPNAKLGDGERAEDYYARTEGKIRPLEYFLKGYTADPDYTAIMQRENIVETDQPMDGIKGALCGSTERKKVAFIHGDRVRRAFEVFTTAVKFKDIEVAKVIFASMLIKDGAIILKGVAGTGKTTMIETLSMLMANPVDYVASADLHPDGMFTSANTLDALKSTANGTVGIAKHNPDKQPDDIYYYSRITNDEYMRDDYEKWLAAKAASIKESAGGARRNPYELQFVEDPKVIPTLSRETVFDPQVRPIVTHPIKFHNEGNRMNSKVADATLGLLAEKEIEFYGKTFPSPSAGPGAFTLLDYNPHKDWEPRGELDRALLDRFDCSVFVPALDIGNKVDLMGSGAGTEPRARAQTAINHFVQEQNTPQEFADALDPLSYEELCEVWKDVNQVALSRKQRFFAACYTNTFSVQFYKYPAGQAQNFYKTKAPLPIDEKIVAGEKGDKLIGFTDSSATDEARRAALMPFMDASLENFGFGDMNEDTEDYFKMQVKDTMQANSKLFATIYHPEFDNGQHPGGTIARLNENYRPLGYRNTSSLVKLGKAYTWLQHVLDGDYDAGEEGLFVQKTTMKKLLPYIIAHRLNIGLGENIKQNYINAEDWVANDVVPEYINKRESNWEEMYNGVYETMFGYGEGDTREEGLADGAVRTGKGSTGQITEEKFYKAYEKVMTRKGGQSAQLFYRSVMADPMAAGILDYAYKMAKDISTEPSVWIEDEKDFLFPGNEWATYDGDTYRPIFADEE